MGKTTLLAQMIIEHYSCFCHSIIVLSSTYPFDEKWKAVVHRCPDQTFRCYTTFNLPIIKEIYQYLLNERQAERHSLLVIDDMTRELRSADKAEKLYDRIIANNRWFYTSIIQSAQKVVHVAMEMRLNWDNLITFYPDNQDELTDVYKTCGRLSRGEFERILRFCTNEPYSFMYVRRHDTTTSYYRRFTPLVIVSKGIELH